MTHRLLTIFLALLLAGPVSAQTAVPQNREQVKMSFSPLVKRAAPAVVNVFSRRVVRTQASPLFNDPIFRQFFGNNGPFGLQKERVEQSLGSGVIVGADGTVVTNHHVIKDAQEIRVVLADRREFDAKVLLSDQRTDLAVLKIDAPREQLPMLVLGDSDRVEVGDLVLAIGNPFGVGQTVTSGIVSAVARTAVGVGDFRSFIQTDAAINPGNSGGALIDLDGRLVGINTAIYSQSGGSIGIGFAIPAALVRTILDGALHGGRIVRPWLGAGGQSVTSDIAQGLKMQHPGGVLINEVTPGGPAAQAGLAVGDVVLAIEGHEVDDSDGMRFRLATMPATGPAKLTVWRGGQRREVTAMLVPPPETPPRNMVDMKGQEPFAGATVGNLNPAFVEELGLPGNSKGVVVDKVTPGTPAAQLGLQRGDVIAGINDRNVETVARLQEALGSINGPWKLAIKRGDKVLTVVVRR